MVPRSHGVGDRPNRVCAAHLAGAEFSMEPFAVSIHQARPEHEVAYQDMVALLRRHGDVPALEMLAVAANMVGKIMALQDQRSVTPQMAIEIVMKNIEKGNQDVLALLDKSEGSA